jgi:hypothetical protein
LAPENNMEKFPVVCQACMLVYVIVTLSVWQRTQSNKPIARVQSSQWLQKETGQNYWGLWVQKICHISASREQQASRLHTTCSTNVVMRVVREKARH